jgi:hypothetical protein
MTEPQKHRNVFLSNVSAPTCGKDRVSFDVENCESNQLISVVMIVSTFTSLWYVALSSVVQCC